MRQMMEYVSPAWLSEDPVSVGQAGLLYVRFVEEGVQVQLRVGNTIIVPDTYSDFLRAVTDGILRHLPGQVLTLRHVLPYVPEGEDTLGPLEVKEQVWFDLASGGFRFRLEAAVDGRKTAAEANEFDIAMDQLVASNLGRLNVCFSCRYADYMSYGGEDLRHGWHCFRDLGVDPASWERWWDHEDDFGRAIQGVNAFHWCPSFKERPTRSR